MRCWVLVVLLFAAPLTAAPWNRDRPGDNHLPTVADVCCGRFDMLPPAYYQMRIARLEPLVAASVLDNEDALAAIDNLATAHLRLGQIAPALTLIDRKLQALPGIKRRQPQLAAVHLHRASMNRALCLLARWRQRGDRADLEAALPILRHSEEITRAITDNRLFALEIEFLLRAQAPAEAVLPNALGITEASFRGGRRAGTLKSLKLEGAITHLVRRLSHGAEGENPDLYYALSLACALEGRNDDALLAWQRTCELLDSGRRMAVPYRLSTDALRKALASHLVGSAAQTDTRLAALQAAARAWREPRMLEVERKLSLGEHPDTHPRFWQELVEPPPPAQAIVTPAPADEDDGPMVGTALFVGGGAAVLFLFLVVGGLAIYFARHHPRPPSVDEI